MTSNNFLLLNNNSNLNFFSYYKRLEMSSKSKSISRKKNNMKNIFYKNQIGILYVFTFTLGNY